MRRSSSSRFPPSQRPLLHHSQLSDYAKGGPSGQPERGKGVETVIVSRGRAGETRRCARAGGRTGFKYPWWVDARSGWRSGARRAWRVVLAPVISMERYRQYMFMYACTHLLLIHTEGPVYALITRAASAAERGVDREHICC